MPRGAHAHDKVANLVTTDEARSAQAGSGRSVALISQGCCAGGAETRKKVDFPRTGTPAVTRLPSLSARDGKHFELRGTPRGAHARETCSPTRTSPRTRRTGPSLHREHERSQVRRTSSQLPARRREPRHALARQQPVECLASLNRALLLAAARAIADGEAFGASCGPRTSR